MWWQAPSRVSSGRVRSSMVGADSPRSEEGRAPSHRGGCGDSRAYGAPTGSRTASTGDRGLGSDTPVTEALSWWGEIAAAAAMPEELRPPPVEPPSVSWASLKELQGMLGEVLGELEEAWEQRH